MAVTPQDAELAQYQELTAQMRHWEQAIDTMLRKGGRVFHYVNKDFDAFLPILTLRYYQHGWLLQDGGLAGDGETRRILFVARQEQPAQDKKNEQPAA